MDTLIQFLIDWGNWGMLIAAFLAGSFVPFSSEAVMIGLIALGLDSWELAFIGSIGNSLGSFLNYGVGRMGKLEWVEKYLHVSKDKIDRAQKFMGNRGAWMGFFAFVPLLGSAIAIALGLMRSNVAISFTSITIGKILRYALVVASMKLIT